MRVYILNEHYEVSEIFITKEIAEDELVKRKRECSYCTMHGDVDSQHSLEVYEAK